MQILALMAHLYAPPRHTTETADRALYAKVIADVVQSDFEAMLLVVVARQENWFHRRSRTPPFGVTDWVHTHRRWPSHGEGARIARRSLLFIGQHRCPERMVASILGRYHHGVGTGLHGGCYPDRLSLLQARDVDRALAWVRRSVP